MVCTMASLRAENRRQPQLWQLLRADRNFTQDEIDELSEVAIRMHDATKSVEESVRQKRSRRCARHVDSLRQGLGSVLPFIDRSDATVGACLNAFDPLPDSATVLVAQSSGTLRLTRSVGGADCAIADPDDGNNLALSALPTMFAREPLARDIGAIGWVDPGYGERPWATEFLPTWLDASAYAAPARRCRATKALAVISSAISRINCAIRLDNTHRARSVYSTAKPDHG